MTDGVGSVPRIGVLAVLGAGSMGSAIARGSLFRAAEVRVTARSAAGAAAATARGLEARSLDEDSAANRWAVTGADVVIAAVKPAGLLELLGSIGPHLADGALVVSVAAGVTTAAMERALPPGTAVVRAMPNTPAAIGAGVTGLAGGASADADAVARARAVFEAVGTVLEVGEERIDALSAISGSGPAYVFYAVEQLTAAAERLGFDPDEARRMVLGTVSGAVRLLEADGAPPAELRRRVTSPNGTTERAIAVFESHRPEAVLDEAFAAAVARARELAAG